MRYGSSRFQGVTVRSKNTILFTDVQKVVKVAVKGDILLLVPKNQSITAFLEGYPHEDSWLPMWFIILYHAQHETVEELAFQEELSLGISSRERERLSKALIWKAHELWREYKLSEEKDPKIKYKALTRILQDILLYLPLNNVLFIRDQQRHLESHAIAPLVFQANEFRREGNLHFSKQVENEMEKILSEMTRLSDLNDARESFEMLRNRFANSLEGSSFVIWQDTHNYGNEDQDSIAKLLSYDLEVGNEHDHDVVSILPFLKSPRFYGLGSRFGPRFSFLRRMDVIAVPEKLDIFDCWRGDHEFQPPSMIIATHSIAVTDNGRKLQKRICNLLKPEFVASHYLGASEEFLHRNAWGKSFPIRIERKNMFTSKKLTPLSRVARDLLPRAVYLLKTGTFPIGVSDSVLWKIAGVRGIVRKLRDMYEQKTVAEQELYELFDQTEKIFLRYYQPKDYVSFRKNLTEMGVELK